MHFNRICKANKRKLNNRYIVDIAAWGDRISVRLIKMMRRTFWKNNSQIKKLKNIAAIKNS
jgi:RNase P subunit RPR2